MYVYIYIYIHTRIYMNKTLDSRLPGRAVPEGGASEKISCALAAVKRNLLPYGHVAL